MKYIRKFQREHGLTADGIIGRLTLRKMRDVFELRTPSDIGHFLGQVAEETGNFQYGKEQLNYSLKGLLRVFPKYFDQQTIEKYARKPEAIANRVYANRMGNRNEQSGDGWKFRGRGAIQLTGHNNYNEFSKYIGDDTILTTPDIVEKCYYWDTALWYFSSRNIWQHTAKINIPTIRKITKLINGGYNGIDHRIELTKHFYQLARKI